MAENKAWGPVLASEMLKQIYLLEQAAQVLLKVQLDFVVYQSRLEIMYIKRVFYLSVSILLFFLTFCHSKPSRKSFQSNIKKILN